MSELWQPGAVELARMIRSGATSSREVIEAHLARIDETNPSVNAVVRRLDDTALAAADEADAALARGDAVGPFHGVPFTVKENIDLAGTPTTQGLPALSDAIADVDAPVVERMRAAGAIPIGRTNTPDMGLRIHTESSLHGLTRNPHAPRLTAGGSSGGEAAAIATGMSPLGLGNDIGGSLRNPAHCCGISSLKPTVGVVPMATVIPPLNPLLAAQQMVVTGPMAREVADLSAALDVLAGPDRRDPRSIPVRLTGLADGERLRIAVMDDPPGGSTDPGIKYALRTAADHLSDAGHEVFEVTPPDYERVIEVWAMVLVADIALMRPVIDQVAGADARLVLDRFQAHVPRPTPELSAEAQSERFRLMREWSEFFAQYPVLLSPTWAQPPFEIGADLADDEQILRDVMRPVVPANVLALPAAVVPCGAADGLPVGVQVIGDRFTDRRCLAIAGQLQEAFGAPAPIDPVTR